MSQQPITSCHNVPAVVVGGDEGTNHYECPVCHEPVNIDGSNPSQQPDHFTSMPDDQFKKRLKQTAEQSDKELDEILPPAGYGMDRDEIVAELKQRLNALIQKKVREARIDELDGVIFDLEASHFDDTILYANLVKIRAELQDNQAKEDV